MDAMLGVAMERESEMLVCASIRCKASSVQNTVFKIGRGAKASNTRNTDEKDLELWVAQSTCFTEVLKMQSTTMDGFPTGKEERVLV